MSGNECQCRHCQELRNAREQGPRPGWLQREFDAARKAVAPPAAGPWIKIEPGCEMPERGFPVLVKDDELGRQKFVIGFGMDGEFFRVCGGKIKGATHYAPINPPEAQCT